VKFNLSGCDGKWCWCVIAAAVVSVAVLSPASAAESRKSARHVRGPLDLLSGLFKPNPPAKRKAQNSGRLAVPKGQAQAKGQPAVPKAQPAVPKAQPAVPKAQAAAPSEPAASKEQAVPGEQAAPKEHAAPKAHVVPVAKDSGGVDSGAVSASLPAALSASLPGSLPGSSSCRRALTASLADAPSIPDIHGPGACGGVDLVRLEAVVLPDKRKVAIKPPAILRCEMAAAVVAWVRGEAVKLTATMGTLSELDNFDSYECRGRNRVAGAQLSEHGLANALDVRALRLADGRRIGLTDANVAHELRQSARQSLCGRFTTVLGPGSDGYHEDHIHLDLRQRHRGFRICHWEVRDGKGTAAAAQAGKEPSGKDHSGKDLSGRNHSGKGGDHSETIAMPSLAAGASHAGKQ